MARKEESSAGNGSKGKGKAPVNSFDRLARTNSNAPEVQAAVNQLATMSTGNSQPKPRPTVPAGAPAPAPASAPNETFAVFPVFHFSEVRSPQAFDHEARPPPVAAETERRSNMSSLARLFKIWPKSKDPPSKSHPKSRVGGDEEEGEKEDGVVGLQRRPRRANTQRVSFATVEIRTDSGTGFNPSSPVAPGQFSPPTSPPTRVMSPGIAAEYIAATRTLGVPDVAPPQRAPTPIISRPRGRASSAQYPGRFREPFEDA